MPSEAVIAELERVASSPVFGGPARQIKLLRYLVHEALAGHGEALTAARIAHRVFERSADFDPAEDSIVRVEISKLRRALDRYYAATPGHALRIEIERGRIAPSFVEIAASNPGPLDPARSVSAVESPVSPPVSQVVPSTIAPVSPRIVTAARDWPCVAVLPFVALSARPGAAHAGEPSLDAEARETETDVFARGLSERLHSLFGMIPCVTVLSRAATLDDAAARGARYVVEGTVRLVAGTARVTAKAHDTKRWVQVWAGAYDRPTTTADLFAVEDEIARAITNAVVVLPQGAVHAYEAEERSGAALRTVYDAVLRSPRWLFTFDRRLLFELREACARLVPSDDDAGVLFALAAHIHLFSAWTIDRTEDDRSRGAELARRAVRMEPRWPAARQVLALAHLDAGDGRGALAEAEAALDVGGPLMLTGHLLAVAGEWERGIAVIRVHTAALKRFPGVLHHTFMLDAYRRGDYAAGLAEALLIATPVLAWDSFDRAVSLARLGRVAEARAAARELCTILPEIEEDPRSVIVRMTADEALREGLLEGLRIAGIG